MGGIESLFTKDDLINDPLGVFKSYLILRIPLDLGDVEFEKLGSNAFQCYLN